VAARRPFRTNLATTKYLTLTGFLTLGVAGGIFITRRQVPTGIAHVEIVTKGLDLFLSLPEHQYPVNAIVQATMRVTNVSTHAIELRRTSFYGCGGTFAPQAVVMSNTRAQVFPPIVAGGPYPECSVLPPGAATTKLPAGAALASRQYLLLRWPQIRAFVTLAGSRVRSGFQTNWPGVGTPILTVTLTRSDAPTVTMQKGSVPVAHVVRPSYARGRLFIGNGWSRLAKHGTVGKHGFVGIVTGFRNGWARQTSLTIRPKLMSGYTRFVEWHVVAGWLGHSAASIDFHQP